MCLAIPGRVLEIYEISGVRMGKADFGGVAKEICLAYLPDLAAGEYTLVHAGFAISRLDEETARETLRTLAEIGQLGEELDDEVSG